MKPAICFEMLFPGLDPAEKIARIAAAGFGYVEFWGWRDKDLPALKAACARHSVRIANFSGHREGSLIAAETHERFFADLSDALKAALSLGCSTLMLLSNALGEGGRVLDSYPSIPADRKYANLKKALELALQRVPENIQLVLEPLNTRIDHPGYFLQDMSTALRLIREIGHPRLKVLCDLYHLGVMGEDLERVIGEEVQHIGYFHVADFPGRHEPGTGSANWVTLLGRIAASGYSGIVGFEYAPAGDSLESLARVREIWAQVLG